MIGKFFEFGAEVPYRHPQVWQWEQTTGPDRLRIGAGPDPVDVMLALAAELSEPLFLLVVLRVARRGEDGRWESHALTLGEVVSFVDQHRELFELDGRTELWIGSTSGEGLLVLDEHDLIYAYGPLNSFEEVLEDRSFEPGEPLIPDPHEHHYNEEFDHLEVRLREWSQWRRVLPLEPEDE